MSALARAELTLLPHERAELATVRCPGCDHVFVRVGAALNPPKGTASAPMECVCKNRRCRRVFWVRLALPAAS